MRPTRRRDSVSAGPSPTIRRLSQEIGHAVQRRMASQGTGHTEQRAMVAVPGLSNTAAGDRKENDRGRRSGLVHGRAEAGRTEVQCTGPGKAVQKIIRGLCCAEAGSEVSSSSGNQGCIAWWANI